MKRNYRALGMIMSVILGVTSVGPQVYASQEADILVDDSFPGEDASEDVSSVENSRDMSAEEELDESGDGDAQEIISAEGSEGTSAENGEPKEPSETGEEIPDSTDNEPEPLDDDVSSDKNLIIEEDEELLISAVPGISTYMSPRYSEEEQAEVTSCIMYFGNTEIDILEDALRSYSDGRVKSAVDLRGYDGTKPLRIRIEACNADYVDHFVVTGNFDGELHEMTASRLSAGVYEAQGYFIEGGDNSGLKGISLRAVSGKHRNVISNDENIVPVSQELVDHYEKYLEHYGNCVTVESTDDSVSYKLDFSEIASKNQKKLVKTVAYLTVEAVDEASDSNLKSIIKLQDQIYKDGSYFIEGINDERYALYRDNKDDPLTYVTYLKEIRDTTAKYTKFTVKLEPDDSCPSLETFNDNLDTISNIMDVGIDAAKNRRDFQDTIDKINSSKVNNKDELISEAENIYKGQVVTSIATNFLFPVVIAASGGLPAGAALFYSVLRSGFDLGSDIIFSARTANILNSLVQVKSDQHGDYVYETIVVEHTYDGDPNSKYEQSYTYWGYLSDGLDLEIEGPEKLWLPTKDEYNNNVKRLTFGHSTTEGNVYGARMNLEEVIYNGQAQVVGVPAFVGYPNIKDVKFNDKVRTIGEDAFRETAIEELYIPTGVKEIQKSAFYKCRNLKKISGCYGLETLGNCVFEECTALTGTVEFGEGLKSIGQGCFRGCSGVTCFKFAEGLENIGGEAFVDCTNLRALYLPSTVQSTGLGGSKTTPNLKDVYFAGTRQQWDAIVSNRSPFLGVTIHFGYDPETGTEACATSGKCGNDLTWELRDIGYFENYRNTYDLYIEGNGPMYDYENCSSTPWYKALSGFEGGKDKNRIRNVVLRDGITRIGAHAFEGSISNIYSLSGEGSIEIPDTVTEIGAWAFYSSYFTGILSIPDSVKTIGTGAFQSTGITALYLGDGLTEIPDSCFSYCDKLGGRIYIPDSVAKIGGSAFDLGSNHNTVSRRLVFSDGLKEIGDRAFAGNINMTVKNTFLPEGLKVIGSEAFYNCSSLAVNTVLPEGLEKIEYSAFHNCSSLTGNLVMPKSLKTLENGVFEGCSGLTGEPVLEMRDCKVYSQKLFLGCTGIRKVAITGLGDYDTDDIYAVGTGGQSFEEGTVLKIDVALFSDKELPQKFKELGYTIETYDSGRQIPPTAIEAPDIKISIDDEYGESLFTDQCLEPRDTTLKELSFTNYDTSIVTITIIEPGWYKFIPVAVGTTSYTVSTPDNSLSANGTITVVAGGGGSGGNTPTPSLHKYLIRFMNNSSKAGGASVLGEIGDITCNTYSQTFTVPEGDYRADGVTFTGWNTKADGTGTVLLPGNSSAPNRLGVKESTRKGLTTVLLYAQWHRNSYRVDFDLGGGYFTDTSFGDDILEHESDRDYANITFGTAVKKLPKAAKDGYVFGGWYSDASFKTKVASINKKQAADMLLIAKWIPYSYKVKFNANKNQDGEKFSVSGKVKVLSAAYGEAIYLPNSGFINKGYKLAGWALNERSSVADFPAGENIDWLQIVDTQLMPLKNKDSKTLYAVWEPVSYSVGYEPNIPGLSEEEKAELLKDYRTSYDFGDKENLPWEVPALDGAREGYTFGGWYADPLYKKAVKKIAASDYGDKTLYARWSAPYSVVLHDDAQTFRKYNGYKYDKAKALPSNPFKNAENFFMGWSTSPTGTEVTYVNKEKVKEPEIKESEEGGFVLDLYAVWKSDFTLTVNMNGGAYAANEKNIIPAQYSYPDVCKKAITLPKKLVRPGYKFGGFYKDPEMKKKITGISRNSCADYVLYAKWTPLSYKITYVANAPAGRKAYGKMSAQKAVYGTDTFLKKNEFFISGYRFLGWSINPAAVSPEYTDMALYTGEYTNNVKLYAVWEKKTGQ
ncbi:MAG: leucine-rich repeat protein [Butyrivibrio sp.]|nr:leucine-rich repeat protein [Butyrivibrio sp.]